MHYSSTPGRVKGSRLVGGAVTEEALDSSAAVLERRGARTRAGLQRRRERRRTSRPDAA
jgi:hypothetical protein